jgi:general secretion pathway protein F
VRLEEEQPLTRFRYRAYTPQNVVTEGTIAADGVEAAIDALYQSGLTPFETSAIVDRRLAQTAHEALTFPNPNQSIWKREFFASNRFNLKELTAFTVELASLTDSGLPLDETLRVIAGPGATPKTHRLAHALLKDIVAGAQLSEAMSRRPDIFPPDYRAILAAGEAGGAIGPVVKQIAQLLARRLEIRNKVAAAIVYPAILVAMSMVSILVIVFVLVPSISPIFIDAGMPLPGILSTLAGLQENWLRTTIALGLSGVVTAIWWSMARHNDRLRLTLDRIKCSLPLVGTLIRIREAGGFARALGTLLCARVSLMSALHTSRALVTNRYLTEGYAKAIDRVPEGTPLHQAFNGSGLIPAAALRLVTVGEETGQLGPMLAQAATILENDLQRQIDRLVGLLTPLLTLAIGGGVGALIMEVMRAVLSINDLAFQ